MSAFGPFGDGDGVAVGRAAGKHLVVVEEGRAGRAIGLVIDVNAIGDRQQPRPRVPHDRPRPEMPPDSNRDVLEEVIRVVRIAAETAEHCQDGRAMLIDQGGKGRTILVHAEVIPGSRGRHWLERPSVLRSKTSVWIKVFDRREKLQWPARRLF